MSDDNAHAGNVADLLRTAEEDEDVPEDLKERARERREELEEELTETAATVYLAGPVAAEPDGGAGWRNDLQERYADECDFRDPLAKYNVKKDELKILPGTSDPEVPTTVGIDEIVENDKRLIDESDGILVGYSDTKSVGTPMEVMYARERDMPVALWLRDNSVLGTLSPWYRYHATCVTNSVELALEHIERMVHHGVGE